MDETSAYKVIVLRRLNCDTALASGKFINFQAKCPECRYLVVVS